MNRLKLSRISKYCAVFIVPSRKNITNNTLEHIAAQIINFWRCRDNMRIFYSPNARVLLVDKVIEVKIYLITEPQIYNKDFTLIQKKQRSVREILQYKNAILTQGLVSLVFIRLNVKTMAHDTVHGPSSKSSAIFNMSNGSLRPLQDDLLYDFSIPYCNYNVMPTTSKVFIMLSI